MNLAQANTPSPNNNNLFAKIVNWFGSTLGKILVSILVPAVTFIVLWQGYLFFERSQCSPDFTGDRRYCLGRRWSCATLSGNQLAGDEVAR